MPKIRSRHHPLNPPKRLTRTLPPHQTLIRQGRQQTLAALPLQRKLMVQKPNLSEIVPSPRRLDPEHIRRQNRLEIG
jgi:hypothetical protein